MIPIETSGQGVDRPTLAGRRSHPGVAAVTGQYAVLELVSLSCPATNYCAVVDYSGNTVIGTK